MDNNSRLKVGDIVQHFKREFLRGSWVDSSSNQKQKKSWLFIRHYIKMKNQVSILDYM